MVVCREAGDESSCCSRRTCEKLNMLVAPGSSMVAAMRPSHRLPPSLRPSFLPPVRPARHGSLCGRAYVMFGRYCVMRGRSQKRRRPRKPLSYQPLCVCVCVVTLACVSPLVCDATLRHVLQLITCLGAFKANRGYTSVQVRIISRADVRVSVV